MKALFGLFLFTWSTAAFAHPGDDAGRVLAAVPALAKVYRLEHHQPREIARSEDGWRATGVIPSSCWKAIPARPPAREFGYCALGMAGCDYPECANTSANSPRRPCRAIALREGEKD